jgi:uncharacterized membrane protein YGL010W
LTGMLRNSNQLIHIIFVPCIFWSSMVMLGPVTFDSMGISLPPEANELWCDWLKPNFSLLVTIVYVLYYLALNIPLGSLAGALVVGLLLTANKFNSVVPESDAWRFGLGLHVLSWAVQFYGHDIHEG